MSRTLPGLPEETYLAFPNRWFVGSQSGCSCSFRHLSAGSAELGFGEPEDWFPEDTLAIEATLQAISLIRSLVKTGASVDVVDAWTGEDKELRPLDGDIEVDLEETHDGQFRFYENYRFTFARQT